MAVLHFIETGAPVKADLPFITAHCLAGGLQQRPASFTQPAALVHRNPVGALQHLQFSDQTADLKHQRRQHRDSLFRGELCQHASKDHLCGDELIPTVDLAGHPALHFTGNCCTSGS